MLNFSYQCTVNEQLHVHNDESRYSCDIRTGECPFLCEVCNKAFSKKDNLITHKCIHSGERPYSCEVCNKVFSQESKLITHQRIHSGERPYICDVCKNAYTNKNNLRKHKRKQW